MFKEGQELDSYGGDLIEKVANVPEEVVETEEEIDKGMGVLVKKKTLYHGSATPGIKQEGVFKEAIDVTVGNGLYLTSKAEDAINYAHQRKVDEDHPVGSYGKKETTPTLYEASIENMKLLDLRRPENILEIVTGFKKYLKKELKKDLKPNIRLVINQAVYDTPSKSIGVGEIGILTQKVGGQFREFVKSIGYDGLITIEGGESGMIKNHDTYVIFDPEKVKIVNEQQIEGQ